MAIVYVLRSSLKGKLYTGSSHGNDPRVRLASHNAGKMRSTKAARPWIIVYVERLTSYTEARKRELFLKSGQGRLVLKGILGRAEVWLSGRKQQS